jgi:Uma2 family endonuclease
MWEGVLHTAPAPAFEHQRILGELLVFLHPLVRARGSGTLVTGINVFDEVSLAENYRIPDLTFVAAGREAVLAADGTRGGGPDAVLEVRSPDDETCDKLPFFAKLGVLEVIVVDRDSKRAEVYRLAGAQYLAVTADADGGVVSDTLGVRFHRTDGPITRLVVQDVQDPSVRTEI